MTARQRSEIAGGNAAPFTPEQEACIREIVREEAARIGDELATALDEVEAVAVTVRDLSTRLGRGSS